MNTIDLTPFVSKDESRFAICRPFSLEEWTYATDGRILIRVPRRVDVPEYEESPKSAASIIPTESRPLVSLPEFVEYDFEALEREKDCGLCEGGGSVACETCGHEEDCNNCNGKGIVNAAPKPDKVVIDGVYFNQLYLTLIKRLPNVRLGVSLVADGPARIEFDDGEGALMPMKKGGA